MSKLSVYGLVEQGKTQTYLPYRINQAELNKKMFRDYGGFIGRVPEIPENMAEEIRLCVEKSKKRLQQNKVALIKIYPRVKSKRCYYYDILYMYLIAGYNLSRNEANLMIPNFKKNDLTEMRVICRNKPNEEANINNIKELVKFIFEGKI